MLGDGTNANKTEVFNIGDPVQIYYKHLKGYSPVIYYINRMQGDKYVLGQEHHPQDHLCLKNASELKCSEFTNKQHPDLKNILRRIKS